jgi:hypothetical protein
MLQRLLVFGLDPSVANEVISALRSGIVRILPDARPRAALEDAFHHARILTTRAVEGVQAERRWRACTEARAVMESIAALASAQDIRELARLAHIHLPRIGIARCFVIALLGTGPGALARYIVYESPNARDADGAARPLQRASGILRDCLQDETDPRALAVYPIVLGNGEPGLFVLELGTLEGYCYDLLKRSFESALARMGS